MRVWHPRAPALRLKMGNPVPRHRSRIPTFAGDRPPRYGLQGRLPFTVGRGPVPRHASVYRKLAGETRSDARVASEGPALREHRDQKGH